MKPITLATLVSLYPTTNKDKLAIYVEPLNIVMNKFQINTANRAASFLAQIGHESGGFVFVLENLNYSAVGLRKTFGKYFPTDALAAQYARKPEKIANRVYASRMGNGDEASGDGWRYKGRGVLQVTGKNNYSAFATDMKMKLSDVPAYLETPLGAVMGAGWFWNKNGLNAMADDGKIREQSIRINGGTNGMADRLMHYDKAKSLLA